MKTTLLHTTNSAFPSTQGNKLAALLLPLMLLLSAPVQAGFLQIDFGAIISNDGGVTTDTITGQFVLDNSALYGINVGGQGGIIVSGNFTSSLFGTELTNPLSGFTFAAAAQRTGYGAVSLVGAYGAFGLFSLELASDNFFTSANAFDDLTDGLSLGALRSFNPSDLDTTRFINLIGGLDDWQGALNFLEITPVTEPTILALFGMGLLGLGWARRRQL